MWLVYNRAAVLCSITAKCVGVCVFMTTLGTVCMTLKGQIAAYHPPTPQYFGGKWNFFLSESFKKLQVVFFSGFITTKLEGYLKTNVFCNLGRTEPLMDCLLSVQSDNLGDRYEMCGIIGQSCSGNKAPTYPHSYYF